MSAPTNSPASASPKRWSPDGLATRRHKRGITRFRPPLHGQEATSMIGAARYDEYPGRWGPARGRNGRGLMYWPLAKPFLVAGLIAVALLIAFAQIGIFSYALGRLG